MEPLPPHIRPEDAVYFERPRMAPMTFRARWWLGIKVLIAAQLAMFPIALFFEIDELLNKHAPEFGSSWVWILALLVGCFVLSPLLAASMFRYWAAAFGERLFQQILPSTPDQRRL